jgi:hypothetical protein
VNDSRLTDHPDNTPRPQRGFIRRAISALGGALRILFWLVLGLWLFAQITTDRTLIGQYAWWFAPVVLGVALGLLLVSRLFRALGKAPPREGLHCARWATAAALGFTAATTFNLLAPLRAIGRPPPPASAIHIVHWNSSGYWPPDPAAVGAALASDGPPDIVFTSLLNLPQQWEQITSRMPGGTKAVHFENLSIQKIFSRYPITFVRSYPVPMKASELEVLPSSPALRAWMLRGFHFFGVRNRAPDGLEDGVIIVARFDTKPQVGRELVAYFIDMPSNPLASRHDIAARVAAEIARLQSDPDPAKRIPPADVVLGDFNIPTGSASLQQFLPGGTPASGSAGIGRLASWPRPHCLFQIDHALIAPGWAAGEYRLIDPIVSEHMAQSFRLWPEAK